MDKMKDNDFEFDDIFDGEFNENSQKNVMAEYSKRIVDTQTLTIIQTMEGVNAIVLKSRLSPNVIKEVEEYTRHLCQKLDMTVMQIIFLGILMERGWKADYSQIARYMECSRLRIVSYASEMETLIKRHYVRVYKDSDGDESYYVHKDAMKSLIDNEVYVPKSYNGLKFKEFLNVMFQIIQKRIDEDITFDYYKEEIENLLTSNTKLKFVKELRKLKLSFDDVSVFLACVYYMVDNGMALDQEIHDLTRDRRYSNSIQTKKCILFKHKLIEKANVGPFSSMSSIVMTDDAREKFLHGIDVAKDFDTDEDSRRGLTLHEDIPVKQLFFNATEQSTMNELSSMLQEENFKTIKRRLEEKKMRTGFSVCLFGAPGTGKTEFVLQLARLTQRDVMLVDIAGLRDKYVGESEKNVKRIFKSYQSYCENCVREPILFLNEADGIISKRRENVEHGVDTMENAMVDIILNEMENFKGIMFATTNHQVNMDPATERRFIYRVELHKPDAETRVKIWESMLPDIPKYMAESLSQDYELAGGNIENISRLATVNEVLYGKKPSLEQLQNYCKAEVRGLKKQNERKSIAGFGR